VTVAERTDPGQSVASIAPDLAGEVVRLGNRWVRRHAPTGVLSVM